MIQNIWRGMRLWEGELITLLSLSLEKKRLWMVRETPFRTACVFQSYQQTLAMNHDLLNLFLFFQHLLSHSWEIYFSKWIAQKIFLFCLLQGWRKLTNFKFSGALGTSYKFNPQKKLLPEANLLGYYNITNLWEGKCPTPPYSSHPVSPNKWVNVGKGGEKQWWSLQPDAQTI